MVVMVIMLAVQSWFAKHLSQSPALPRSHSTTVFSHSQTVVECPSCHTVLCTPTGGKAKLTEGMMGWLLWLLCCCA